MVGRGAIATLKLEVAACRGLGESLVSAVTALWARLPSTSLEEMPRKHDQGARCERESRHQHQ